jgi:hypothetical protein
MIIVIPTRGRIGRQLTLNRLPIEWAEYVHIWATKDSLDAHRAEPYAAKVAAFHCAPEGIAASRQAAVDWAIKNGIEWVWFLDDDLYFCRRAAGTNSWSIEMEITGYDLLLSRVASFMEDHVIIGVIRRGLYLHHPEKTESYTHTFFANWAVNVRVLEKEGIRIDEEGPRFCIDDWYTRLRVMEKGYRVVCLTDYGFDHTSNSKGGASAYRTPEFQAECTERLVKRWPQLVTVAKGKGAWNAVNPKVNWKKALSLFGGRNVE